MKQILLILIVLAVATIGANWLLTNKPEIKKHTKKPNVPVVKISRVKSQSYTTVVHSSGVVEARTQTNIVAEVAGKITLIGKAFQEGNYLRKNNLLLRISETDYQSNINIAKAEIAQQQLALEEQRAQRDLAKQDWDLFGEKRKTPSALAMRTPHIASAKAALQAAKTRMEQAKTQLSRTKIRAPYDGRVLERSVDVGQYVTPGTILGKVFATDYIEIRLPLSLKEYDLLNIPEHYQNEDKPKSKNLPTVTFYTSKSDKKTHQWQGKIVRTSAVLDSNTRQLSVIARIDEPFSRRKKKSSSLEMSAKAPLLKLGQFLQADIKGKQLSNVILIPISAVREQKEVLLFIKDENNEVASDQKSTQNDQHSDNKKEQKSKSSKKKTIGIIKVQAITILHTDNDNFIIAANELPKDSQIILTPPPFATDGMKVKVFTEPPQKLSHTKSQTKPQAKSQTEAQTSTQGNEN